MPAAVRSAMMPLSRIRLDARFDNLARQIIDGLVIKDDASVILRRLPAATTTRQ